MPVEWMSLYYLWVTMFVYTPEDNSNFILNVHDVIHSLLLGLTN